MEIINNIGLITVFLLVLISAFLLTNQSSRKSANVLFAGFLLVTSFDISALFLSSFYAEHSILNYLRVASVFLQMPLFYLYVKKICFSDFSLKPIQLLHAVPFLVFVVIYLTAGITYEIDMFYAVSSQFQYYIYMAGVFLTLYKYKRIHNANHSLQSETYQWLLTTAILFLIGNSIVLFRGIFQVLNDYEQIPLLNIGISFFGLLVVTWFVLKTMRNPELFTQVIEEETDQENSQETDSSLYQEEIEQLHSYMITNKPFLHEAITLNELSEMVGTPSKHLSFLINQILGKHYFDFINSYRIQEAQRLLKDSDLTIQQIMYEVGFNSKSSFNTAFKKNTSITPSQYRQNPH